MKNFKISCIALASFALLAVSCNRVMDTRDKQAFTEEVAWQNRTGADGYVFEAFKSAVGHYGDGAMVDWDKHTTNTVHTNGNDSGLAKDETTINSDYGFTNFGTVRRINLIMDMANKYGAKGNLSPQDVKELTATAKFIRAAYYYGIARTVGRFVYIDKVLSAADTVGDGLKNFKITATTTESYSLMIKDLTEAIPNMPTTKTRGALNQAAANSLLCEVALQGAAYERFNKLTGEASGSMEEEWLNLAISAAKATFSAYPLTTSYSDMFKEGNASSSEIILGLYRLAANFGCTSTATQHNTLPNMGTDRLNANNHGPVWPSPYNEMYGWLWWTPSQNLVDDYLVVDKATGKAVKWNESSQFNASVVKDASPTLPSWAYVSDGSTRTPYLGTGETGWVIESAKLAPGAAAADISALMYADRDARFYGDIVYDGCTWLNRYVTTRDKGNLNRFAHGQKLQNHLGITNYFVKKMTYNAYPNVVGGDMIDYHWVIFRTGRNYLNAAEAYLWKGDYANAVIMMNETRTTHGQLPPSTASSLAEAWADYKIERHVELFFERDYYFSLLRWGIHGGDANHGLAPMSTIPELTTTPTYIEISKDTKDYYVSKINFGQHDKRVFNESNRYLLPIPKGKIDRNPANWGPQNYGWR